MGKGAWLHQSRINEVLYRIHQDISVTYHAAELAEIAAYSPFHFQRIFKEVTGENLNDYVRRTRLEWAANRLIFEPQASIADISVSCGFQSHASFTHAFRRHFGATPSDWRRGGYQRFQITEADPARLSIREQAAHLALPEVQLLTLPEKRVAYVRHQGYDRGIASAWQTLLHWAKQAGVECEKEQMIGLHHSNPGIVPLAQCRYVACLTVPKTIWRQGPVGVLTIPGGLHAVMQVSGVFGDLLPVLDAFYHRWLPNSAYQLRTTPAYALYQRNQFLDPEERFELTYAVPVQPHL